MLGRCVLLINCIKNYEHISKQMKSLSRLIYVSSIAQLRLFGWCHTVLLKPKSCCCIGGTFANIPNSRWARLSESKRILFSAFAKHWPHKAIFRWKKCFFFIFNILCCSAVSFVQANTIQLALIRFIFFFFAARRLCWCYLSQKSCAKFFVSYKKRETNTN